MPFVFSNHGLHFLVTNAIGTGTDIRALVVDSTGSTTDEQIRDVNTVDQLAGIGLTEVTSGTCPNYARQDLAGVTVTENDTDNRVDITATAPTINSVGPGPAWKRVVYYIEGAGDSSRIVLGVDTPASTITPNGGNITLPQLNIRVPS